MTGSIGDQPSTGLRLGVVAAIATAAVIAGAVTLLHGPSVPMALTGDSYQWIQHAHLAAHRPALLAADLDTFYRPSTTWTLVVDRMVWGGFEAPGYRTSSLVLHGLAAWALAIAGRRLGLGWIAAAVVALVWVTSPFTGESAFVVAYRFQPLLLISWLALIAAWPRRDESWSGLRFAAVAVAVLSAAAAKETWVVTPLLVAGLEFERQRTWRATLIPTGLVGCAVAGYVLIYFLAFPSSKSYFEFGPHAVAKIPAQLAAFLYLEEPVAHDLSLTWMGLLAVAVMAAIVASCVRWRAPGWFVACCVLLLPTVPTLFVAYMPQRYLAIPYAGFLLLLALWADAASDRLPRWRSGGRAVAFATAALVCMAGAATVRADLADYRTMANAHALLLEEAEAVKDSVLGGVPVAVVRDERTTPLLEILRYPQGLRKPVFIRNWDPYGLIDAAALFEWVIAREGMRVEPIREWSEACNGVEGVVLVHTDGGFVNLGITSDLTTEAERWQAAGRRLQVVRAISLD